MKNLTKPHKQPKTVLAFMVVALICSSSSLVAATDVDPTSVSPNKIVVAKVNGQPILRVQLERRILETTRKAKSSEYLDGDISQINPGSLQQALSEEIAAELFFQGGKKLDIPDAVEKIAEQVVSIKASLTDEQRQEFSDEYIKTYVQRRFYINKYMEANDLINPKVPEEEIKAFYERTKQGYASKTDEFCVRHVLAAIDKDEAVDGKAEARKRIEKARQLLLDGEDFVEVAKKYSQDATSVDTDAVVGCVGPGFMPVEFEKVAFSLKPGVISEIVETKYGFHVLDVVEIRPKGTVPPYRALRSFFEKYLSSELKIKKAPEHVKQIREKAKIEILSPLLAKEGKAKAGAAL